LKAVLLQLKETLSLTDVDMVVCY